MKFFLFAKKEVEFSVVKKRGESEERRTVPVKARQNWWPVFDIKRSEWFPTEDCEPDVFKVFLRVQVKVDPGWRLESSVLQRPRGGVSAGRGERHRGVVGSRGESSLIPANANPPRRVSELANAGLPQEIITLSENALKEANKPTTINQEISAVDWCKILEELLFETEENLFCVGCQGTAADIFRLARQRVEFRKVLRKVYHLLGTPSKRDRKHRTLNLPVNLRPPTHRQFGALRSCSRAAENHSDCPCGSGPGSLPLMRYTPGGLGKLKHSFKDPTTNLELPSNRTSTVSSVESQASYLIVDSPLVAVAKLAPVIAMVAVGYAVIVVLGLFALNIWMMTEEEKGPLWENIPAREPRMMVLGKSPHVAMVSPPLEPSTYGSR
ncbi:hypothetical protein BDK51DRAFT_43769 [Blyttiomyces helicus]|uniref:Uncharacterized protein n=1 Tax=Blyttiomyces helicus TaxID=388810 RepID=A0A4P9WGE8_9FUNG|nr:hypothetical protein BDK51DRAFT_43769 [Blyttiomyces helicus]|eukprot:RKO90985.1 hypothetical protein BDK51DRAFT_43769 [Blyttiomyces helicus]